MINKADHIITVSNELRKNIISLGCEPEKISVIGSGVDTSNFKPLNKEFYRDLLSLPQDRTIFLYIGRLHVLKGISKIIEIAQKKSEDLFVFIGDGEIPPHPENCVFLGSIDHPMIPGWIGAADCILLPSSTEGLPNVLMEALSSGRPAIASDVGGCPEIIENMKSGILIRPEDKNEFLSAIDWMESHITEREKMGIFGRKEMIKHYEHEKLIDKLIKIHMALLGEE